MSVINTNMQALTAARNLSNSQEMLGRSLNRLSSGSKIVSPSDDAAGLAVSEKLDAQNQRVKAAMVNVQNAVSFVQTADGFMSGMTKILSRMSELGLLAKDVTKNTSDVALYQTEFQELQNQLRYTIGGAAGSGVGGIGGSAVANPLGTFNGIELFSSGTGHTVTIGEASNQTMNVPSTDLRTGSLLAIIAQDATGAYTLSLTGSTGVIDAVTNAIQQIATERASLGASQSRLELASGTLSIEYENLTAAVSRIRDVDVAQETTQLARYNILVQSGTAMLAQANQSPQSVLKLLQ
jgi:flagellin